MYTPFDDEKKDEEMRSADRPEDAPDMDVSDSQAGAAPEESEPEAVPESTPEDRKSSEYSYVRPDEPLRTAPYTDAGYVPQSDAPVTPRRYYNASASSSAHREEPAEKNKKRGGKSALIIAMMCVACLIVGICATVAVNTIISYNKSSSDTTAATSETTTTPTLSSADSSGDYSTVAASTIYDAACKEVVGITSEITTANMFGQTTSAAVSGSGFIVSEDGYILTNNHVISTAYEGGYDISVMLYDGTKYKATVVGTDSDNDTAVLKIDATGLTAATLGDSDAMQVGEAVYAVGNPLGELTYTMTNGIVSALNRAITTEANTTLNMFQISAAVNSGNSGGPVYNSDGQVIGIVTAKYSSTGVEGIGFALPINDAISIANELIANGYVSGKAYMGVSVYNVSSSAAYYYNLMAGAYVGGVTDGSCASKAGIQVGDTITAIGDTQISSMEEMKAAIKNFRAGDTTTVTVYRNGNYETLSITFDEEKPSTAASASSGSTSGSQQPSGQSSASPFPSW